MPTTKLKQKKVKIFCLLFSGACAWGQGIERGLPCEEQFASCEDELPTTAPAVIRGEPPEVDAAPLPLRSVAFSPDGAFLAVGTMNLTILVDAVTHKELRRVQGSKGPNYAAFLPDGRLVTQGYQDNRSLLWDAKTGELLGEFIGALVCADTFGAAWRCNYEGRGVRVSYASYLRPQEVVLSRWDGKVFSKKHSVKDRQLGYPVALATGPSGAFAVAGKDGYPRTERPPKRYAPVIRASGRGPKPACPLPDPGDMIVSGGYVRVWSGGGALDCQRMGLGKGAKSLSLDHSGRFLLVGDSGGEVFLLDRRGNEGAERGGPRGVNECVLSRTFSAHTGAVVGVAFSPDDRVGVSVGEDGALFWWDLATGDHSRSSFFPSASKTAR